jgi:hypothetical protein
MLISAQHKLEPASTTYSSRFLGWVTSGEQRVLHTSDAGGLPLTSSQTGAAKRWAVGTMEGSFLWPDFPNEEQDQWDALAAVGHEPDLRRRCGNSHPKQHPRLRRCVGVRPDLASGSAHLLPSGHPM